MTHIARPSFNSLDSDFASRLSGAASGISSPVEWGFCQSHWLEILEISHIPKALEVKKEDRPLIDYLDTMYKAKPAADFGKKLDEMCAAGASVARALALHHAIAIGIRMSASDIGHLIRLKADINAQDHVGNTPLHIMASSWVCGMDPDQTRSLLGGGAHLTHAQKSLATKNLQGHTPLDLAMRSTQNLVDFVLASPGSRIPTVWAGHDELARRYEALLLMQQPQHAALLIDGWMTPRMRSKLTRAAEHVADNCRSDMPEFENYKPMDVSMLVGGLVGGLVRGFDFVPPDVLGEGVYKTFALGYLQVFEAIKRVLEAGSTLPTPANVFHHLRTHRYDNCHMSFFQKRGEVEFALDAVISYAAAGVWELDPDREDEVMQDGNFGIPAHCPFEELDEYTQLPEHPLDNDFELVRYKLIGPLGKFKHGPFRFPRSSGSDDDGLGLGDDDW